MTVFHIHFPHCSLAVFTIAPLDAGLRQFSPVAVSINLAWSILMLSRHMAYPSQFDVLRQNCVHFLLYPKWTSNGKTAFLWHGKTCGVVCMYLSANRHGVTFFAFVSIRTINITKNKLYIGVACWLWCLQTGWPSILVLADLGLDIATSCVAVCVNATFCMEDTKFKCFSSAYLRWPNLSEWI
jgi:hypothetical protein